MGYCRNNNSADVIEIGFKAVWDRPFEIISDFETFCHGGGVLFKNVVHRRFYWFYPKLTGHIYLSLGPPGGRPFSMGTEKAMQLRQLLTRITDHLPCIQLLNHHSTTPMSAYADDHTTTRHCHSNHHLRLAIHGPTTTAATASHHASAERLLPTAQPPPPPPPPRHNSHASIGSYDTTTAAATAARHHGTPSPAMQPLALRWP
jgi:hypothetical protein